MSNHAKGQSVVELLIAMGIFALIVSAINFLIIDSYFIHRLGREITLADFLAEEGIEAVRSIRDNSWKDLAAGEYGLAILDNKWVFQGSEEDFSVYLNGGKRKIIVTDLDLDRKKITSQVVWKFTEGRVETLEMITYLTNWLASSIGDWSNPLREAGLNISGNNDGLKIQVQENYAYFIRNDGTPDFIIVDITNSATPIARGTSSLIGVPTNIAVSGNYVYVSNTNNSQELQVIDISSPDSPSLIGTYDAQGSADANGVYVIGTTVYLVRTNSTDREFFIIDVSDPALPTFISSLDLGATGYEVFAMGNYAYVASGDNDRELQVINITDPKNPVLATSLNLPGNIDAITITGFANRIIVGQGSYSRLIDVTTPTMPALRTSFDYGGTVNDLSLGNSNNYLFTATSRADREFQVIDIFKSFYSPYPVPTLIGSYDISGSNPLRGIAYDENMDRTFAVGNSNTEEFIVIAPR